jgi:hypothetical protein
MADRILRAPNVAAGASAVFKVSPYRPRTVYLYPAADLTATEQSTLQREDPAGTFQDVYDVGFGGIVQLNDTVTGITVTAEGVYRINVADPTAAIGVAIADQLEV